MLATRLRKVLAAVLALFLVAFASPVLTTGTASADLNDGYFTYTSNGTSITITGCTMACRGESVSIPATIEGLPVERVTGNAASNWAGGYPINELTIPSSVSSFSVESWRGNVASIVFAPNSKVSSFPEFAFANNGNLRSIVLPDRLRTIAQYAFYNAGLYSITIPGTVTSIGSVAFASNRFTTVTIPASVTSLAGDAFSGNVTKTFAPPAVSSVTYSLNGGSMPGGASLPTQADATQNTTFTVGNGTEPVKDGYLFGGWSDGSAAYGDGASYPMGGSPVTLSAVWLTVTWNYTINNNEVTVKGCTPSCPDAALTIPSTIESLPVTTVNSANFSGVHIAQLTIPNSVTAVTGNWQGGYNITRIVFAPGSKITHITDFQFANNGNLRSIVLPDHLRSVGVYAFTNAGLDSITFPGTVTSLPSQSFTSNRFTTVTIPASVTSLAGDAFSGNVTKTFAPPAVSSVTYSLNGGSMPGGALLPTQADATQNTTFTVGNGIEPVKAGYLFGGWSDGSTSYPDGSSYPMGGSPVTLSAVWLTVTWSYTINNGRVTVSGCTPSCPDAALTIPSTIEGLPVTSVTSGGFGSVHIPQLTIPNSVTTFDDIWQGGYNITRIVFAPGSKITRLRDFLFANNGNLRSIVMPDHLRQIGQYTFYNAGLDSVTIPGTVTSIEGESFRSNRFTSVTIPWGVTSLSSGAFDGSVTKTFADPAVSPVTYNLNGGSMPGGASAPSQANTTQGQSFTVGGATDPVLSGFQLAGWSDFWGTVYDSGESFLMGGVAETLTAVWERVYSVTYDLDGGAGTLPTHSPVANGGSFQVASADGLAFDGYTFLHWSDGSDSYAPGETYTVGESDVTLTAAWERVYSVTYDLDGGVGTLPTHSPVANGGSFQLASADGLTLDGYTFLHWSDGSDSYAPGETYTVGESDVTLTAVWSVNQAPIPDNVLPPGASEGDLGEPTNITLGGSLDTTLTLGSNGTNASILIPAGALPSGTTLSVYPVLETAGIADSLPAGQNYVVSLVVTWSAPDGSVPLAGVPLTMTISNAAIKAGDQVYKYVGGDLSLVGTATQDGTITFTFDEDPTFTVATPTATDGGDGDGGSGGNGSGGTDETGDPSDGVTEVVDATVTSTGVALPYTGSNVNMPVGIALVLFTLGGAMVLGTRRKKASLVPNDENELIS